MANIQSLLQSIKHNRLSSACMYLEEIYNNAQDKDTFENIHFFDFIDYVLESNILDSLFSHFSTNYIKDIPSLTGFFLLLSTRSRVTHHTLRAILESSPLDLKHNLEWKINNKINIVALCVDKSLDQNDSYEYYHLFKEFKFFDNLLNDKDKDDNKQFMKTIYQTQNTQFFSLLLKDYPYYTIKQSIECVFSKSQIRTKIEDSFYNHYVDFNPELKEYTYHSIKLIQKTHSSDELSPKGKDITFLENLKNIDLYQKLDIAESKQETKNIHNKNKI